MDRDKTILKTKLNSLVRTENMVRIATDLKSLFTIVSPSTYTIFYKMFKIELKSVNTSPFCHILTRLSIHINKGEKIKIWKW